MCAFALSVTFGCQPRETNSDLRKAAARCGRWIRLQGSPVKFVQRSLTGARRAVGDTTDAIDATTTVGICRDERGGGGW